MVSALHSRSGGPDSSPGRGLTSIQPAETTQQLRMMRRPRTILVVLQMLLAPKNSPVYTKQKT